MFCRHQFIAKETQKLSFLLSIVHLFNFLITCRHLRPLKGNQNRCQSLVWVLCVSGFMFVFIDFSVFFESFDWIFSLWFVKGLEIDRIQKNKSFWNTHYLTHRIPIFCILFLVHVRSKGTSPLWKQIVVQIKFNELPHCVGPEIIMHKWQSIQSISSPPEWNFSSRCSTRRHTNARLQTLTN